MSLTSNYCCKNFWVVFSIAAGVLLASVFLFPLFAKADEADFQSAISDLGSATGQDITTKEQALEFCNQEKYFDTCADIGKKHNLYTEEEIKQVDNFLSEVKGKILDDIKNCADETCLIKAAEELAKKIQAKNPTLATNFNITAKVIEEKKAVVEAAKEVGINFKDCESMDPDTASIDLLRKCAKLAKDSRVQKYIPEEKRVLAQQFEDSATVKLREALVAGKYQCGDNTLEGCGNFCLNPAGTGGIPPVCAQIASEVFGADGVKQLETAHQQVRQVKDYYSKKFILILPSGKELVGEGQIRSACDQAFSGRNLEIAKACGNFAVKNGFVSQAEVDRGLKLMESFVAKAQDFDFDKCLTNPAACRDFIPSEDQERFDAGNQIFEIMKTEIGFDPSQCERGSVDETIGTKCFEGSKRALSKIESLGLANKSREARFILEDIKRHVSEGENFIQKKEQFREVFSQQGGPGGCKSEAECFTYCSNSANGPECISFGSKHNVSGFQGGEAVQRFNEYNHNLQRPGLVSDEYRPYPPYSGQGPYPGFQPPGQGGFPPPGQIPGFNQPGPGFGPPPGTTPYYPPYPDHGTVGPSPECFAAIQSGDFTRAKTACTSSGPSIPFPTGQTCPASSYVECPAGQYHESYRNSDGCWIDGPCKPAPTYSPGPYPTYTYSPGPYPTYSPGPGSPYPTFSPSGDPAIDCQKSGGAWDEAVHYCKYPSPTYSPYTTNTYSPGPYPTYSPNPTYSPGPGTGNCSAGYHYHGESGGFCMNDQENYGGTCYNATGTSKITCPAQPTYTPAPSCPSGQWWDYSANTCRSSETHNCPSGQWWDYAKNVCVSSTSSYSPAPSCPSGQWWDEISHTCKSSTSTYSPAPTYTYSPAPTYTSTYSPAPTYTYTYSPYPTSTTSTYTYTPPPSCPPDQYWNGTACVSSTTTTYTPYPTTETHTYTPYPTTEYTPPPTYSQPPPPTSQLFNQYIVAHCQQLGRTWNGKICQANGLFARFYENSGLANVLRLFYLVP